MGERQKITSRMIKEELQSLMHHIGEDRADISRVTEEISLYCDVVSEQQKISFEEEISYNPRYFISRLFGTKKVTNRDTLREVFKGLKKHQQVAVLRLLCKQANS